MPNPANHCNDIALLLIDVINPLDHDRGEALLAHALPMSDALRRLGRRARAAGIPVIYVNDNFGHWEWTFTNLVESCLRASAPGRRMVQRLRPEPGDYYILKPRHSGFFSTSLDLLLEHLGARTLILTGVAGDICVLFTANDAYMRGYRLAIPCDCIASHSERANDRALDLMRSVLKAETRPGDDIDLAEPYPSESMRVQ